MAYINPPDKILPFQFKYKITVNELFEQYFTGDTLDYLCMRFDKVVDWINPMNNDADSAWSGKVSVGDKIILNPVFEIDMDVFNEQHIQNPNDIKYFSIYFIWRMIPTPKSVYFNADSVLDNRYRGKYSLLYDFDTGEYSKNHLRDYIVY